MKINLQFLFAVSVITTALTAGNAWAETKADYLTIKNTEVEVKSGGGQKQMELEVETQSPIPVDGKSGAFGYAFLTDGGNNVLVAVTHLPIDDSSYENPDSGFHTHVLDLMAPTKACDGASFEVDLANSAKNSAFDANYTWKVEGNEVSIKNVPVTDLGDAGVETIAAFTLKPVLDAKGKPSNLCVTVVDKN
jgi:hypothetical protein